MDIQLPEEQQSILAGLVASGRYSSAQDAISEGIHLLVQQENLRHEIQTGIDQAERGEVFDHETVFEHLRATTQARAANG